MSVIRRPTSRTAPKPAPIPSRRHPVTRKKPMSEQEKRNIAAAIDVYAREYADRQLFADHHQLQERHAKTIKWQPSRPHRVSIIKK